jgi:methylglutaconyl-CoA hydratase
MGLSAYSQLALDASSWQTADWACSKGLFTRVFETAEQMDEAIAELANTLTRSNPEALRLLKQVFWEGTERWDTLLDERAAISGQLVLSDFTRNAIAAFKKN